MSPDRSSLDRPYGLFAGLSTVDIAYRVSEIPAPNQKVSTAAPQIAAGGPATNAAVTFAFLGGKSVLISAIGQHALSSVIRKEMEQYDICLHDIAEAQCTPPPLSSILVLPNGDRTVVSANANAFPDLNVERKSGLFNHARFVLLDGHYPALCNVIACEGRAAGLEIILDAGSWKERMSELLPNITIALCSNDFLPPGTETTAEVFQYLSDHGIERVAVTRGANSIPYMNDGVFGEIPVEHINEADTTAAGDVFHGAFCYRFSLGHDFVDALAFAAKVATFSCMHSGTRSWMSAFSHEQHVTG